MRLALPAMPPPTELTETEFFERRRAALQFVAGTIALVLALNFNELGRPRLDLQRETSMAYRGWCATWNQYCGSPDEVVASEPPQYFRCFSEFQHVDDKSTQVPGTNISMPILRENIVDTYMQEYVTTANYSNPLLKPLCEDMVEQFKELQKQFSYGIDCNFSKNGMRYVGIGTFGLITVGALLYLPRPPIFWKRCVAKRGVNAAAMNTRRVNWRFRLYGFVALVELAACITCLVVLATSQSTVPEPYKLPKAIENDYMPLICYRADEQATKFSNEALFFLGMLGVVVSEVLTIALPLQCAGLIIIPNALHGCDGDDGGDTKAVRSGRPQDHDMAISEATLQHGSGGLSSPAASHMQLLEMQAVAA